MVSPRSKDPLSLRHQEINSRVFRPQTSYQISKPNLLARVVVARTNPSCLDQFQVGFPSLQWLHKYSSIGPKVSPCYECDCGSLAEENVVKTAINFLGKSRRCPVASRRNMQGCHNCSWPSKGSMNTLA